MSCKLYAVQHYNDNNITLFSMEWEHVTDIDNSYKWIMLLLFTYV